MTDGLWQSSIAVQKNALKRNISQLFPWQKRSRILRGSANRQVTTVHRRHAILQSIGMADF
ncbi:MAG: hypothetical protein JHC60_10520 [Sphingobium sp.]|uniref:hypothetical protein n=1 Tax=Sphingobium cupriresistens TaxID=1132417 RepID=UPI0010209A74|nr:hypothetical protein [Sphingobium sp.]